MFQLGFMRSLAWTIQSKGRGVRWVALQVAKYYAGGALPRTGSSRRKNEEAIWSGSDRCICPGFCKDMPRKGGFQEKRKGNAEKTERNQKGIWCRIPRSL